MTARATVTKSVQNHPSTVQPSRWNALRAWLPLLCAVVAFAIAAGQNLKGSASRTTLAFDSMHYMKTVQMLVSYTVAWLHHSSPQSLAAAAGIDLKDLQPYLLLDGPLLAGVGTVVFTALGKLPSMADWRTFILVESAFQALSAAMVCLLTVKLTRSQLASLITGLAWACYPSAIAGCNSFLTEIPSTALLLTFVYCLSTLVPTENSGDSNGRRSAIAIVAGVLAAVLFCSKPALGIGIALCVVAWLVLLFCQSRRAQLASTPRTGAIGWVVAFAVAAGLTIAPWALWTHAYTTLWLFTAHRSPTLNISRGSDPTSDGWMTMPATPYSAQFHEWTGAGAAIQQIWKEHPAESLNLLCRKAERLWTFPWNDYGHNPLGLNTNIQLVLHRLVLVGGIAGLILFACTCASLPAAVTLTGLSSSILWAEHLIYLPFETLPRYGFTAMPLVFALAAYAAVSARRFANVYTITGLIGLMACAFILPVNLLPIAFFLSGNAAPAYAIALVFQLLLVALTALLLVKGCAAHSTGKSKLLGTAVVAGVATISAACSIAHCFDGMATDWRCDLKPANTAVRQVSLPSLKNVDGALLLVDGERNLIDAQIKVNGHELNDRLTSIYQFDTPDRELLNHLRVVASAQGRFTTAFRQWRAVSVPIQYLKDGSQNTVELSAKPDSRVTIYGSYPAISGDRTNLPGMQFIAPAKVFNGGATETRIRQQQFDGIRQGTSLLITAKGTRRDLSNAAGMQTGEYRMYIALLTGKGSVHQQQPIEPVTFQINPVELSGTRQIADPLALPNSAIKTIKLPQSYQNVPRYRVIFSGMIRAQKGGKPMVGVALTGLSEALQYPEPLSEEPRLVSVSSVWQRFEIVEEVAAEAFPKGFSALSVSVSGVGADGAQLANTTVELAPSTAPTFKEHEFAVY